MDELKSFLEKLTYWVMPRGPFLYLRRRYKILKKRFWTHIDNRENLLHKEYLRNKELKKIHLGKRCFILATGPSISNQDLKPLSNEYCIAVNDFYLHNDIKIIKPEYHVLPPYHPPFTTHDIRKRFLGIKANYPNDVVYFFGHNRYEYNIFDFLNDDPKFQVNNRYFIDYTNHQQLDESNFQNSKIWDISKAPFSPRTVVYIAIQVAVYLGFQSIYLLGCDHDYLHDVKRVTDHHFYPEERGIDDSKHLSSFSTERWFQEYYYRWKQYRLMREYLEPKGVQIYNATRGGMLDVFPRVQFEDLIT